MINFKRIKSVVLSGMVAAASVAGSFSVANPSLKAEAANDDYAKLLQYSLYFYDANMCGSEVNSKCGMTWRGNCHADDEVAGGFHDAGDHAMFGLPQGFTASTLGWAYYEFPDAFDDLGQTEHLKMITDYFCDFFKKSTKLNGDTVTNFLYQKGDGTVDHSYWGPPEQQGSGRKMFWTSNGASEIAAQYAAALAANYKNFGNAEDLKYAKALYKFSKQYNQLAPNNFYGSNSLKDDQAWAAGWLAIATGDNSYVNDARSFGDVGWVHGWNDSFLGAACLSGELTGDWSAANGYISSKANGSNYMFLDKWGSARLNCSMQMTALIATKHGKGDYKNWAKGQMDYILGNNPVKTCFVTGFASNSTKNPHHRAASGYTSYEQFNMNNWDPDGDHMNPYSSYGSNSHTLIGALAGGPCDASGTYHDNMGDYICNEVAIDYNAGLVGAAAGLYHFYKTGKTVSSIEGVDKIYSGGGSSSGTTPPSQGGTTAPPSSTPPTQTTIAPSTGGDVVLLPDDMTVGTEEGTDGEINNYAEFNAKGYKTATLYYTVNTNDMQSSGGFGTWTGEWEQVDFEVDVKNGKVEVTYDIPSNVGATVKAMIWWPHDKGVTIEKVVLSGGSSSNTTKPTTTKTTSKPTTTKSTSKPTTTKSTVTTTKTTPKPTTTKAPQPSTNAPTTAVKLYGDANNDGRVTLADATAIYQSLGNPDKYALSATGKANADVIGNGNGVTAEDAITIQKVHAGLLKLSDLPIK
ncbi:MAG: glycoside hydrolase family 9 protein [Ruminococcus sp.]|nr:glycoside hydrolase family 9 protein [Ruminococcus sp.]